MQTRIAALRLPVQVTADQVSKCRGIRSVKTLSSLAQLLIANEWAFQSSLIKSD